MTQGLVTITCEGQVLYKIVTGCDGYNVDKVVRKLKGHTSQTITMESLYDMAMKCDFGHESSLVVISQEGYVFNGDDELGELYRATFNDPTFNPRWEVGTAPYVRIVEVDCS